MRGNSAGLKADISGTYTIVRRIILISNRLLKNVKHASFLRISRALHLDVFNLPVRKQLFQQPTSANCFLFSCFYMLYNFTGKAYHDIAEIIKQKVI